ncbi:putative helix-turn-helix HTH_28 domain containing protein 6 [Homarus americanus]|uniref:Putative helix-turn-helix HTH_28 domain containing protein 6 n=1 Tax=Homarus americanus TaxID=6706 RepID=A0A8J5N5Q2_HOMAM|nr:putative helix-turn-helix HTH_28 domain containing protein 6 [Homarus americanus]
MEVQPQHHVRPPRTRANRPEVITSRGRIIGYHEAGKGLREISRLLGISRDTVRLWVRRYEEEGHVLTRPRPGRPRVTTPAADQQIQRAVERAPLSTADLSFSQNVVNEEFTQPTEQCQDFVSPSTSGIEYDKKKCSGKKKKVEHLEEQTALKKAIDVLNKPQDDYSVFGDNVASELRQLRSDENRKILKRTIMKAIIEMGEKEDLEYSSTSTSTPILPCSSPESHNSNYDTNVGHGTTT